jgi:hypothetical protein
MPATLNSIISAAIREWQHWGRSTWNVATHESKIAHRDDEIAYAKYVIDNYCSVGGGSPTLVDIQDDRYYWSAVGMSAIMRNAGFTKNEFPFAQSHSKFIRYFVAARKTNTQKATFFGYRLGEVGGEPEPGDIVAYARGKSMTQSKALALFDATSSYDSHTDVVVAKNGREIQVIGCNVRDSVTQKTLQLGENGHIKDDQHLWFAVLKRRQVIS